MCKWHFWKCGFTLQSVLCKHGQLDVGYQIFVLYHPSNKSTGGKWSKMPVAHWNVNSRYNFHIASSTKTISVIPFRGRTLNSAPTCAEHFWYITLTWVNVLRNEQTICLRKTPDITEVKRGYDVYKWIELRKVCESRAEKEEVLSNKRLLGNPAVYFIQPIQQ